MYSLLQYISQGETREQQLYNIRAVLDAGCKWVQLRFKNAGDSLFSETAYEVRKLCSNYNAIFIVNDNPNVALSCNADGVHLGLKDMDIEKAREILGNNKIIGGTANTIEDIKLRICQQCNYIGLGPFRFTSTKENLSPVLGIKGYVEIMNEIADIETSVPVYAIGGIKGNDIEDIFNTGVYGIAISGALTNCKNKKDFIEKVQLKKNYIS